MAINRYIALAALFLGLSYAAGAQSAGYFTYIENDEPHFLQRLTWSGGENILRYEIVIEKQEGEEFIEYERRLTLELSQYYNLPIGKYRFRVIPYDLLNRPTEGSSWIPFEVRPALTPEIDNAFFEYEWVDDELLCTLEISGVDLLPDANIFLRNFFDESVYPVSVIDYYDGSMLRLSFNSEQLRPGQQYKLFIENPGGFDDSRGGIVYYPPPKPVIIIPKPPPPPSPINTFLSVSWMPLIHLYSKTSEEEDYFAINSTFSGFAARLGFTSSKPSNIKFGPELMASISTFNSNGELLLALGASLLVQKRTPRQKAIHNFRLGAGYVITPSEYYNSFQFNMGVSLMLLLGKTMMMEFGLDYAHLFAAVSPGHLQPWVGLGFKF